MSCLTLNLVERNRIVHADVKTEQMLKIILLPWKIIVWKCMTYWLQNLHFIFDTNKLIWMRLYCVGVLYPLDRIDLPIFYYTHCVTQYTTLIYPNKIIQTNDLTVAYHF